MHNYDDKPEYNFDEKLAAVRYAARSDAPTLGKLINSLIMEPAKGQAGAFKINDKLVCTYNPNTVEDFSADRLATRLVQAIKLIGKATYRVESDGFALDTGLEHCEAIAAAVAHLRTSDLDDHALVVNEATGYRERVEIEITPIVTFESKGNPDESDEG